MRRALVVAAGALALAAATHCSSGSDGPPPFDTPLPDRVTPKDAGGDGNPNPTGDNEGGVLGVDSGSGVACDTSLPFGTAQALPGAWVMGQTYSTPRLSADELTIYFTTKSAAGDSDMAYATRTSIGSAFGAPQMLATLNSTANDNDPSVAADHLSIWFHSARGGNADIYTATRSSEAAAWGTPTAIAAVNTTSAEAHAYFREAASELWFISNRGGTTYDIFCSAKSGTTYAAPVLVMPLESTSNDWQPQPSEDGLTILLASDRPNGKG
ncbi:MAG TPA: hypothetical protein VIF62_28980, partial [Labilithrix sp.]